MFKVDYQPKPPEQPAAPPAPPPETGYGALANLNPTFNNMSVSGAGPYGAGGRPMVDRATAERMAQMFGAQVAETNFTGGPMSTNTPQYQLNFDGNLHDATLLYESYLRSPSQHHFETQLAAELARDRATPPGAGDGGGPVNPPSGGGGGNGSGVPTGGAPGAGGAGSGGAAGPPVGPQALQAAARAGSMGAAGGRSPNAPGPSWPTPPPSNLPGPNWPAQPPPNIPGPSWPTPPPGNLPGPSWPAAPPANTPGPTWPMPTIPGIPTAPAVQMSNAPAVRQGATYSAPPMFPMAFPGPTDLQPDGTGLPGFVRRPNGLLQIPYPAINNGLLQP